MIQTVDINNIKIRLFDKDQIIIPYKIENTPHFKALNGETTPYDEYYNRMHNFGRAKNNYMNTDQFIKFYPEFQYLIPPYENEYISVKKVGDRYESLDGDHRLSCLKKQGHTYVKVNVVNEGNFKWKGFSNLINIAQCLEDLDDYIVLKGHEYFPNYYDYDDLDILCKDKNHMFQQLNTKIEKEYPQFNIKTKDKDVRIHLDITPPNFNKLNFRFDLLDRFPYNVKLNHFTTHIEVSEEYFNLIFDRKILKTIITPPTFTEEKIKIWFPHEIDDIVLRFLEWVWQPHKTRHIQAVRDNFNNEDEFIDIINKYTNIEINHQYIKELFEDLKNKGL